MHWYEEALEKMKPYNEKQLIDDGIKWKWYSWLVLILGILMLAISLFFLIRFLLKKEKYNNYRNDFSLDRILSQDCNLSLQNYIQILNETNDLHTISLQQLCQNPTCNVDTKLVNMITTVSKPALTKCLKNKDWYRLALINLKIYNMLDFKVSRSLTNGVYGVEYIDIDLSGISQQDIPTLDDKTLKEFILKNEFSKEDEDSIREYSGFLNDIISKFILKNILENIQNIRIDPYVFSIISTIKIGRIVFSNKSQC